MSNRDEQYDLLTAALIGLAVGVSATALFSRGPKGSRPISRAARHAAKGAMWAGERGLEGARWAGEHGAEGARWAGKRGAKGARWVAEEGEELLDSIPVDEIRDQIGSYLEAARDTIGDVVESELRDLRKSIRRKRKSLGI